jgi:hypothetical protein
MHTFAAALIEGPDNYQELVDKAMAPWQEGSNIEDLPDDDDEGTHAEPLPPGGG